VFEHVGVGAELEDEGRLCVARELGVPDNEPRLDTLDEVGVTGEVLVGETGLVDDRVVGSECFVRELDCTEFAAVEDGVTRGLE